MHMDTLYFIWLLFVVNLSVHACVILGDFCYFCHWADDSAGGPEVDEVIYNPVAIYGMMIFWIYLYFGMASGIQYIRDNHAQMHVHLRNSDNKRQLGFKIFDHMQKLQHSWRDLALVETHPVHQNYLP